MLLRHLTCEHNGRRRRALTCIYAEAGPLAGPAFARHWHNTGNRRPCRARSGVYKPHQKTWLIALMHAVRTDQGMAHNTRPQVDLADPVWTIEHVARCFGLSVDRAREYAARDDFPEARRLGGGRGRLFWTREGVLAWFSGLPSLSAAERRLPASAAASTAASCLPAASGYKPAYRPRARKNASAVVSR